MSSVIGAAKSCEGMLSDTARSVEVAPARLVVAVFVPTITCPPPVEYLVIIETCHYELMRECGEVL